MKLTLLSLLLLLGSIHADELERLGYIVNDITKLRTQYSKMSDEFEICQSTLKDEKEKNSILHKELKLYNNYEEKEKNYKDRIYSLENQIKKLKKELLNKRNLKMKSKYLLLETKASAFRVNKDANIYDGVDGKVIDKWEKNTSFTSNQKTKKWIKITGFFVEKVWRPARKEMWISVDDAYMR